MNLDAFENKIVRVLVESSYLKQINGYYFDIENVENGGFYCRFIGNDQFGCIFENPEYQINDIHSNEKQKTKVHFLIPWSRILSIGLYVDAPDGFYGLKSHETKHIGFKNKDSSK